MRIVLMVNEQNKPIRVRNNVHIRRVGVKNMLRACEFGRVQKELEKFRSRKEVHPGKHFGGQKRNVSEW